MNLIAKLEAATGPSRELDARIRYEVRRLFSVGSIDEFLATSVAATVPRYTSSIDAALTLINGLWCIYAMEDPGVTYLPASPTGSFFDAKQVTVKHQSPIIALCIAALKARSAA